MAGENGFLFSFLCSGAAGPFLARIDRKIGFMPSQFCQLRTDRFDFAISNYKTL